MLAEEIDPTTSCVCIQSMVGVVEPAFIRAGTHLEIMFGGGHFDELIMHRVLQQCQSWTEMDDIRNGIGPL